MKLEDIKVGHTYCSANGRKFRTVEKMESGVMSSRRVNVREYIKGGSRLFSMSIRSFAQWASKVVSDAEADA